VNPQGLQTLHAWPADASAHLSPTVSQGVNHAV
jgi:hypothetical protein